MHIRLFLGIALLFVTSEAFTQKEQAKTVIFDTDMGPDYDDVGAITMLHAFADSGYVKILATIASTNYEGVAGVLSVFNTYFNRPNLPIGVAKNHGLTLRDWQHWTDTLLLKYPHRIQTNAEAFDATVLYRKILARQPDHSVTIITVGFFTNLANLLRSSPDQYSPLSGAALVRRKIKLVVSMAGKFPEGKEFNVEKDAASSAYVMDHWSSPIIFSGFDIGRKIKTGLPLISNQSITHSPVKDVFRICIPKDPQDSAGRMSWDETAVLVAVKGAAPFYTLKTGKLIVTKDGDDRWDAAGTLHYMLVEKAASAVVQKQIDNAIQHLPVLKGR